MVRASHLPGLQSLQRDTSFSPRAARPGLPLFEIDCETALAFSSCFLRALFAGRTDLFEGSCRLRSGERRKLPSRGVVVHNAWSDNCFLALMRAFLTLMCHLSSTLRHIIISRGVATLLYLLQRISNSSADRCVNPLELHDSSFHWSNALMLYLRALTSTSRPAVCSQSRGVAC